MTQSEYGLVPAATRQRMPDCPSCFGWCNPKNMRTTLLLSVCVALMPAVAGAQSPDARPDPLSADKAELERVRLENEVSAQKLKAKLRELSEAHSKLAAEYKLAEQKQRIALSKLDDERARLAAEVALMKTKAEHQAAQLNIEHRQLTLKNQLDAERQKAGLSKMRAQLQAEKVKHEVELAKAQRERDTLKAQNDLEEQKGRREKMQRDVQLREIGLEFQRLKLARLRMQQKNSELHDKVDTVKTEIELRKQKDVWRARAQRDPAYPTKPFQEGTLTLSDRRIPLNGPIFFGVADYVTERIHYFNNKSSTRPIFIVIDQSPGGSVMEGYRIVKAIETSRAPIHVVVKSFAASMAAVITTMADESYAYPNAIMLHHQMSTFQFGNMTQLAEQLSISRQWEKRLMGPVAKKLGISIKEFRKRMYNNNSDGDWQEFGDRAKKIGWVKHVVHRIRETGYVEKPAERTRRRPLFALEEQRDAKGQRFVELPRLHPYDLYYLHNPDGYYR